MRHHLDRATASELSYFVMQRVQRERQIGLDRRDSTYCRLKLVTGYNPRLLVADPDMDQPDGGDGLNPIALYSGGSSLDVRKG
jgi:hypothetical protein